MGEDFHSSTSWLKIFFDIFWESNGIWSNKIWTGSWLVSEGLPGLIAEPLTWLHVHVHDVITACAWHMTTWQPRGHFLDLDSACWQGLLMLHIQDIPTPCMRCSGSQVHVRAGATFTIYSDLKTEWPGASQLSPASIPLPLHMHRVPAKIILFGLSLSLSCPERLMRQNESLTPYLGLILGLVGAGAHLARRNCQNVDTRLGIDVNFLPNTRLPEYPHT